MGPPLPSSSRTTNYDRLQGSRSFSNNNNLGTEEILADPNVEISKPIGGQKPSAFHREQLSRLAR